MERIKFIFMGLLLLVGGGVLCTSPFTIICGAPLAITGLLMVIGGVFNIA